KQMALFVKKYLIQLNFGKPFGVPHKYELKTNQEQDIIDKQFHFFIGSLTSTFLTVDLVSLYFQSHLFRNSYFTATFFFHQTLIKEKEEEALDKLKQAVHDELQEVNETTVTSGKDALAEIYLGFCSPDFIQMPGN
ncbi:hypothetical protein ACJX0J_016588, partial [Zea mays]